MSFNRPTLSQLIADALADFDARLPGADSRLRRALLDVQARVHSEAVDGLYGAIDYVARQILPDTAEAEFLTRHASLWNEPRKSEVAASGPITVTGTTGSIIPSGTALARADGARFLVSAEATVSAGSASVSVAAVVAGVAGNCTVGQSLTFTSPVAGIQALASVAAPGISGGAAEESDSALLARVLQRIQNPPHGGNTSDYQRWALEVAAVTRAWVYPGWMGIGTVGVTFVVDGRPDIIPLPADVAMVADHIDPLRPVTAQVIVFAPVAVPLTITVRASPPTPAVEAAIRAEIADLLFREAEPGGTILISHIREAISIAAGESDHELISPNGNQHALPGNIFVTGSVIFIA